MPDRLRIMHLTAPASFGGLERVVHGLATGHSDRGHDVTVVTVLGPGESDGHPLVRALRTRGVLVAPIEVATRAYLRERRMVAALCRSTRPDVVHTHGYRSDVVDAPVARRAGIATVATVHGFTGGGWKNRLFELVDRRALRRADAVVAVSRAQMQQLARAGIAADRLVQIPNAWSADVPPLTRSDARAVLGLPQDGFVIGWVGRVSPEKGPDVLLEALARIRSAVWTAAIVGDGSARAAMEAHASALGLAPRVRWHGGVPDAGRLYRAFDVYVLSSRTEGIPIALFEAMAAGVPIVATDVGAVPEVVVEAEALLVPPDDPAALAAAIDRVAADPSGSATRARAATVVLGQRFGADPWLARYEDVYRRAAARRGGE